MSVLARIRQLLVSHGKELEDLRDEVRRLRKDIDGNEQAGQASLNAQIVALRRLLSRVRLAWVKASATLPNPPDSLSWTANIWSLSDAGQFAADDEITDPIQLRASPGHSIFPGAFGLAILGGVTGNGSTARWFTLLGDFQCVIAKLGARLDAALWTYAWTRESHYGLPSLTNGSPGMTPAYDRMQPFGEPEFDTVRYSMQGATVRLHWNRETQRMEFFGMPEAPYGNC